MIFTRLIHSISPPPPSNTGKRTPLAQWNAPSVRNRLALTGAQLRFEEVRREAFTAGYLVCMRRFNSDQSQDRKRLHPMPIARVPFTLDINNPHWSHTGLYSFITPWLFQEPGHCKIMRYLSTIFTLFFFIFSPLHPLLLVYLSYCSLVYLFPTAAKKGTQGFQRIQVTRLVAVPRLIMSWYRERVKASFAKLLRRTPWQSRRGVWYPWI